MPLHAGRGRREEHFHLDHASDGDYSGTERGGQCGRKTDEERTGLESAVGVGDRGNRAGSTAIDVMSRLWSERPAACVGTRRDAYAESSGWTGWKLGRFYFS